MGQKYDFSGYATKNDLKCSDGRTIRRDAFKDNDGLTVPLVWNHQHDNPSNVLGHALLENRSDGVYAYGVFNNTKAGNEAREMVRNGDVRALSIYANQLKQNGYDVVHGAIREVSLVLAGANPGAWIDVVLEHSDDFDGEAIICFDEELEHSVSDSGAQANESMKAADEKEEEAEAPADLEHAEGENVSNEETVKDVFNSMNEKQKKVCLAMIAMALEEKNGKSNEGKTTEGETEEVKHNVFDADEKEQNVLSHSDVEAIFSDAKRTGSLKDAALAHGIEDIEMLFPEAKNLNNPPEWIKRVDDWVPKVMNGCHHSPFSRIKSMFANITADDARARGYIKGNKKEEEVFTLLKRSTTPQTIYKKQQLDRDDIIDITDFDVVAWIKSEMRGMLDEEIARAVLVGDGRSTASNDKIAEDHIRPIWKDDELYTINQVVAYTSSMTADAKAKAFIRAAIKARKDYKGSGNPSLFTTEDLLTDCLLIEDTNGRVIYDTEEKLRTALRVKEIVTVPVMENLTRAVGSDTRGLLGIIVNLADYNIGADKGGAVNMFDDFDIDYNQYKYLIETRCSGALTKPYSAIALESSFAVSLTVAPETQTTTVLGKLVSALQGTDVYVGENGIEGSLNYVTGYTGFSGDPEEQEGNYLALKFTAPTGATTKIQLTGKDPVTLDSDMNAVIRITNKHTKKLTVTTTTTAGVSLSKTYDLSMLKLAKKA